MIINFVNNAPHRLEYTRIAINETREFCACGH